MGAEAVNIVCLKWGSKYGSKYVNILQSMVERNLSLPHRFSCITEDPTGISKNVEIIPLNQELNHSGRFQGWWYKLSLFKKKVGDLTGTTLYLDLDVVITSSLDDFFTVKPGFWIIRDWNSRPPKNFNNSSVFLFEIGQYEHVWKNFIKDPDHVMRLYGGGDQVWISDQIKQSNNWPEEWCRSFKYHCVPMNRKRYLPPFGDESAPPKGCKIVIFHGKPNPSDLGSLSAKQYQHKWVRNYWRL